MEDQLFEVVDQYPSRALDHAFGQPCGPRGEHDVERVIKGKLLEADGKSAFLGSEFSIMDGVPYAADVILGFRVWNDNNFFN